MPQQPTRRTVLRASLAAAAGAVIGSSTKVLYADEKMPHSKLKKAIKYGSLTNVAGSIPERFEAMKAVGFEGCEIDSPQEIDRQAALDASQKTGVKIHGVIDSVHWKHLLSNSDPGERAKG